MKTAKNNAELYQDMAILMRKGASWLRQREFYRQADNKNYHTLQDTLSVLKKGNQSTSQNDPDNLRHAYLGNLKKFVITKLPNYIEKVADDFETKSK